jgi:hypothetical protein
MNYLMPEIGERLAEPAYCHAAVCADVIVLY